MTVAAVLGLARFGVESFVGHAVLVGRGGGGGNMRCMSSLNQRSQRLALAAASFADSSRRYSPMSSTGATMSAAVEVRYACRVIVELARCPVDGVLRPCTLRFASNMSSATTVSDK